MAGFFRYLFAILFSIASVSTVSGSTLSSLHAHWDADTASAGIVLPAVVGSWNMVCGSVRSDTAAVPSAPGAHRISISAQTNGGSESVRRDFPVWVEQSTWTPFTSSLSTIDRAEYFIDADPGIGSGIPLASVDGSFNAALEQALASSSTALTHGGHVLNVRYRTTAGVWSLVRRFPVFVDSAVAPVVPVSSSSIVLSEYWWDGDPGVGNGTPLPETGADANGWMSNSLASVPVPATPGAHILRVRAKNSRGIWSVIGSYPVYVSGDTAKFPKAPTSITSTEFRFDVDTGVASATEIPQGSSASSPLFRMPDVNVTAPAAAGAHRIKVRIANSKDTAGVVRNFPVYVCGDLPVLPSAAQLLDSMLWFWDTDSSAVHSLVATDGAFGSPLEMAQASGAAIPAAAGSHQLCVRTHRGGTWSAVQKFPVVVAGDSPVLPSARKQIDSLEYYFDVDPGPGAGTTIASTDGGISSVLRNGLTSPSVQLLTGAHTLCARSRNSDGTWSVAQRLPLLVDSLYRPQFVTFAKPADRVYGDAPFRFSASSNSSDPILFTSSNEQVLRIVGDSAFITGAGTVTITASQAGSATRDPSRSVSQSMTVAQKSVGLSGIVAHDKVYDRTTAATLSGGTIVGTVVGDTVSIIFGAASFADAKVGTGKAVSVSGITLGGIDSANYLLPAQPSGLTASITRKSVTVSGVTALDKVYDRTTSATLSGGSLAGIIPGDSVTLIAGTGLFANKYVDTNKIVTVSGYRLGGIDSSNYLLSTQPSGLVASISKKTLTLSGVTALDKVYDATTAASLSGGTLGGVIIGDTVTLVSGTGSFADKLVGSSKPVTVSGYRLAGVDSSNYLLGSQPSGLIASITKKSVSIAGVSASDKVYDGTVAASLSGGTLSDKISGDNLSIATGSGTFIDKNVGFGKIVTATGYVLSGSDASNYLLSAQPSGLTASITKKTLTLSGVTALDKVYDRTTAATLSGGSLGGAVTGDDVTLVTGAGSFADKNAGVNKPVTASGYRLGGTDSSNYYLSTQPSGLVASISRKTVTLSGVTALDKEYDGSASASLAGGTLTDVVAGDTASFVTGVGTFDNSAVGVDKPVTASAYALDGVDAGNYQLSTQPSGLFATIRPVPTLSLVSPIANTTLVGGTTVRIEWTSTDLFGTLTIDYSIDGGALWTRIAIGVDNTGHFDWVAPDDSTSRASLRITADARQTLRDTLGGFFTIIPTVVHIISDPASRSVLFGDSLTFAIGVDRIGGVSFQWQKNGVDVAGAQTATLHIVAAEAADSGVYRCIATNNGGSDTSAAATLTVSVAEQTVVLKAGWNIISFNVIPANPAPSAVFSGVDRLAIVKDDAGKFYIPGQAGTLAALSVTRAYQLYTAVVDTIVVTGRPVVLSETPVVLKAGWNMIAYLPFNPAPVTVELAPVKNYVAIVKDDRGGIWIPSANVNMIGSMIPGRGYRIYMNAASTLVYP